ncbi:MAG: branched-chain amino acid ABC transporter permease [Thermodesulfobacteriota bacterium]
MTRRILGYGLLGLALLILPLYLATYSIYIINIIFIYIILALGLNILIGIAGQFGLCHVAFMGIGVYTYALLRIHLDLPFPLAILAGALLASLVGFIIALPAIRLSDIYLALATFSFGEFLQWVFNSWDSVTRGPNGLQIPAARIGSFKFISDESVYYLILIVMILIILLTISILNSKFGRGFIALRESEPAAKAAGVNVTVYKALAFAISAFYAGIAGGLYGVLLPFIHPSSLGFMTTILALSMIVVGGMGSIPGAIIGACALGVIPELMREFVFLQEMVYGLVLMLFMAVIPNGLYGLFLRLKSGLAGRSAA